MPKLPHEAIVQLIRRAPQIIARLLGEGDASPPGRVAQVSASEYVDLNHAE